MTIKDKNFEKVADGVRPDRKKRVILGKIQIQAGVIYNIYANKAGQILLDPQVTIPLSELWVFENKDILASIDKGMAEETAGQLVDRGSFAGYVKDAA